MNTDLIQKLFNPKKTVEYKGTKFYMRVVTDQVIGEAQRQSLIEARKLRRSLRDVNSDDYLVHLDPIMDLTAEQIVDAMALTVSRDVMREYVQRTPRPVIEALGDYPTQEQQEEYEAAKTEREMQYIEDMNSYMQQWLVDYRAALQSRSLEELQHMYKQARVDRVCEDKFTEEFEARVVAASLYSDEKYKARLFELDQYLELPDEVRQFLRNEYNNLTISPDELKN